ncbi:hypothetical protein PYCC9005_003944 [Savitreella phatthalungensis]
MVGRSLELEWGNKVVTDPGQATQAVRKFVSVAPQTLSPYITALQLGSYNARDLIVSFGCDDVYLYDIHRGDISTTPETLAFWAQASRRLAAEDSRTSHKRPRVDADAGASAPEESTEIENAREESAVPHDTTVERNRHDTSTGRGSARGQAQQGENARSEMQNREGHLSASSTPTTRTVDETEMECEHEDPDGFGHSEDDTHSDQSNEADDDLDNEDASAMDDDFDEDVADEVEDDLYDDDFDPYDSDDSLEASELTPEQLRPEYLHRCSKIHQSLPLSLPWRSYTGHYNSETIKDVNFYGLRDEYVVSGSDDGRLFMWKKTSGKLVHLLQGDGMVTNVIEGNPVTNTLACSGIDDTVKIFESMPEEAELPRYERDERVSWDRVPSFRRASEARRMQSQSRRNTVPAQRLPSRKLSIPAEGLPRALHERPIIDRHPQLTLRIGGEVVSMPGCAQQ